MSSSSKELEGQIEHRFRLPTPPSEKYIQSQRKHSLLEQSASFLLPTTNARDWRTENGFFFIPSDLSFHQTDFSWQDCFLLSIPQYLAKTACDVARYKTKVCLVRYHITMLTESTRSLNSIDDNSVKTSNNPTSIKGVHSSRHGSFRIFLIEVHTNGMELVTPIPYQWPARYTMWTLSQLHRKEMLDRIMPLNGDGSNSKRKEFFNISAKVDAISPIIAMIPTDPFCLIELYDDNNVGNMTGIAGLVETCVVVLKGALALVYHMGIQPGDRITFIHAKRQKWHVPEQIQKNYPCLRDRAPKYVFVLDDPESQVLWVDPFRDTTLDSMLLAPSLPATALPLVSLEGQVTRVQTLQASVNSSIIHFIELWRDPENDRVTSSPNCTTLFLSHFPMPSSLQLSLRPGAFVRAMNVHHLASCANASSSAHHHVEYSYYGACLRSTVALLKTATDPLTTTPTPPTRGCNSEVVTSDASAHLLLFSQMIPLRYCRIRQTYHEYVIQQFVSDNDTNMLNQLSLPIVESRQSPSVNDLGIALSNIVCTSPKSSNPAFVNMTVKPRDPYSEFFGHGGDDLQDSATAATSSHLQCHSDHNAFSWPVLLAPKQISERALTILTKKLSSVCVGNPPGLSSRSTLVVQSGWTASLHLSGSDMFHDDFGGMPSSLCHTGVVPLSLCTGGICTFHDGDGEESHHIYISSSNLRLPVNHNQQLTRACWEGERVVARVGTVITSCLCVGTFNRSNDTNNEAAIFLSSFNEDREENHRGNCAIVRVGGWMFVVAIQLRCDAIACIGRKNKLNDSQLQRGAKTTHTFNEFQTLLDCLEAEGFVPTSDSRRFEGLLTRQRYKFSKSSASAFNGCVLTISHLQPSNAVADTLEEGRKICSFQSMEMKVLIPLHSGKARAIIRAFGENRLVTDDQVNLLIAWWTIADNATSCALVSGGWDEMTESNDGVVGVSVNGPLTAIRLGSNGYKRLSCDLSKLRANFVVLSNQKNIDDGGAKSTFTSVGGHKFLPGMMDKRPTRVLVKGKGNHSSDLKLIVGALLAPPTSGYPVSTLAGLHLSLCKDVRYRTQTSLAPSLVRCIRNASFLGVTFCRAQIECTKCFQPLTRDRTRTGSKKRKRSESEIGVVSFVQADTKASSAGIHDSRLLTSLRCSNGCSLDFAEVKWECSGVLDDGTGQAKLYAERDAALTLLEIPGRFVNDIEEGAWNEAQGCIIFQKSVPPLSKVKRAVQEAQVLAFSLLRQENAHKKNKVNAKKREITEDDVLRLLTPIARAEYLLQRHCRSMTTMDYRSRDFFVRCKPICLDVAHLNRTQIEISVPAGIDSEATNQFVSTYTLPPLKLNLVDCSISQSTCNTPAHVSHCWNLVQDLSGAD